MDGDGNKRISFFSFFSLCVIQFSSFQDSHFPKKFSRIFLILLINPWYYYYWQRCVWQKTRQEKKSGSLEENIFWSCFEKFSRQKGNSFKQFFLPFFLNIRNFEEYFSVFFFWIKSSFDRLNERNKSDKIDLDISVCVCVKNLKPEKKIKPEKPWWWYMLICLYNHLICLSMAIGANRKNQKSKKKIKTVKPHDSPNQPKEKKTTTATQKHRFSTFFFLKKCCIEQNGGSDISI